MIFVLSSVLIVGSLGLSQQAFAVPTSGFIDNLPNCDFFPTELDFGDELGLGAATDFGFGPFPFPPDEEITSLVQGTGSPVCGGVVGTLIEITNLTPIAWHDVIYVADSDTSITNFDGTVDDFLAFRIDSVACDPVGTHHPLISESITSDCIFEPGETWVFVLDDYVNVNIAGVGPAALYSIGLGSVDPPSTKTSSGSIWAFVDDIAVGGTYIPIDTTTLPIAGAQSTSMWMIPVILAGIGIGIFVIRKRN